MMYVPEKITGISHPLVNQMYLKRDPLCNQGPVNPDCNTLIIETSFAPHEEEEDLHGAATDEYMVHLLGDLNALKEAAEQRIGKFGKVDIRYPA